MATNYIKKAKNDAIFSPQEREALELLAQGNMTNRDIREAMGLSQTACENYLYEAKSKLNPLGEKWTRAQFVEAAKLYCEREKKRED